jgi:UDP-GlcNAc:undecaprenyl-phosphate GlcNAc-1-phosphate transferase
MALRGAENAAWGLGEVIGLTPSDGAAHLTRLGVLEGYIGVLAAAFVVALFATPILRRLAIKFGVIDRPSDPRKVHKIPVAYLGGVAVFLGIIAGIVFAAVGVGPGLVEFHATQFVEEVQFVVPWSVVLGMTVIVLVGVIDDVQGISPRVKIGGQLFAAACLAVDTVGTRLAAGLLVPSAKALGIPVQVANGVETLAFHLPFPLAPSGQIEVDVVYWVGTAIIGFSVVALCNASNLLDGLDGLLSGTTSITTIGLLVIALGLAVVDDGPRDSQRIILCCAVLGACLGFLPHNFNPATIFLGDAGSLLLGYCMCVLILSLGDTGKTHLVAAGVIAYMLPLLDTALAIVRRKMEGKSISSADDQHIHHMLKRSLGVKRAVFVLYAIAGTFAVLGAAVSLGRARMVYLLALLLIAYIGVTAIKIARRKHIEAQALAREGLPVPAPMVPAPMVPAPMAPTPLHAIATSESPNGSARTSPTSTTSPASV